MSQEYWNQNQNNPYQKQVDAQVSSQTSGLQEFFTKTFTWMSFGLALTGMLASLVATNETLIGMLLSNPFLFYGLLILELGMVFGFGIAMRKGASAPILLGMFLSYAALNGVTLSVILMMYTFQSVAATFFISAGMFGGMALFGIVTKKDLSGMGRILGMAVWGLILAMIVNMFMQSSGMAYLISFIGVGVFAGLTAYDVQNLKGIYFAYQNNSEQLGKAALAGALKLYLDFINMFLFLLRLLGNRR